MPHGRPSLPTSDLPIGSLPSMSFFASKHTDRNPGGIGRLPVDHDISPNITSSFRVRNSTTGHAQQQQPTIEFHSTFPRPHCTPSSDQPDSTVFGGPPPSAFDWDDDDSDEDEAHASEVLTRPLPTAQHLPHRSSTRLSHTSSRCTDLSFGSRSPTSNSYLPSPGQSSGHADFPVVPSRPPLRPTVSFGGVSSMSYYSNRSAELELEARSLSLARAEESLSGSKWSTASWSEASLRTVRSFACLWPESRRKGKRKGW